ncbi:hypothetical protein SeMB42_g01169 [Synchytrium endobioticum]|uniref:Tf2-1-like SH3-like domain-containing protein n=1 Tax=Synchytrium endobioticum TaxID=286115 RepID=A0A507DPG4_9FUNG|nr:hypothetical protein SeLEV6574_g07811 [Synchytrium endobioticum]TPX52780.1 hypothetical protein SeMB42_g01169 [Synchytrium endobioticum]
MVAQTNKHRLDQEFLVGEEVLVTTANWNNNKPSKKLDHLWSGPYEIKKCIGKVAYQLDLPSTSKCHNVFHIGMLEPYVESKDQEKISVTTISWDPTSREVINIQDHRKYNPEWQYLVELNDGSTEWENAQELMEDCWENILEYHQTTNTDVELPPSIAEILNHPRISAHHLRPRQQLQAPSRYSD